LGKAIALATAQAGANVALTYATSANEARQTLKEIERSGVQGLSLKCDLRDEQSIRQMVAQVLERFHTLDLLINNAGVFQTAKLEEITAEQWDQVFAVNVRAPFLVSKYCIPALAKGLAPEIAVNCVAPGMIDAGGAERYPELLQRVAEQTPMKKAGTPEDVVS